MSPHPHRFTVCSFNLWEESRKDQRRKPLSQFLDLHRPDILCVQELRPWSRDLIDGVLKDHERVDDPFEGWLAEGNIWWNRGLFTRAGHGAEDTGIHEKLRKLFWVRLALKAAPGQTLVVSTSHYTWNGNPMEASEGLNPRPAMARRTLEKLKEVAPEPEPVMFMGDLNDDNHPIRILREGGLKDVPSALGRSPRTTFPAEPAYNHPPEVLDWILFRGPLRPMAWDVVDFHVDQTPPSDHKPVIATFAVQENSLPL
jgi:endonuclease/exonuclease/phosphatase family metal-dependent hydrolase